MTGSPAFQLLVQLLAVAKQTGDTSPAIDRQSLDAHGVTGEEFIAKCHELGLDCIPLKDGDGYSVGKRRSDAIH